MLVRDVCKRQERDRAVGRGGEEGQDVFGIGVYNCFQDEGRIRLGKDFIVCRVR